MIRVSGRLLLSLINDILDMSKIEAGQMTVEQAPFRLGDVIENVAGSLGVAVAKKAIEIVISPLPAGVAYIVGDALRLEQVLTNLCSNAEKFTQTGSIRLSTSVVSETHASAMLRFSVTDTGLGIQPELQSGIFAAFSQADTSTTRRFGGTGLGLAICQQLVVLMGGDIGVISTLGVGSEFWFTVPLQHANASDSALLPIANQTTLPAPSSAVQATGGHLAGLRILVVDDSDINRGVLQHILVGQGASVSLAEDGQQAMDWLLAHADAVDIVLMDVQMPVLDGMEATRRLRCLPQFAALPIVALTAGVFKSQHEAALAAGMTHFVSKPFDVRSTIALIQRLCSPLHSVPPNATLQIPTANAAPAIADIDVAQGLKLWQDNATYQAYLRRFVSDYRDAAVVLQDSLARGDRQGAAALAHKLSGVAANLALPNTRHAAQALERLLATPDDPALALTLLHQSLSAAVAEINRYAPPAPAAHEASEPVSQQPLSLTPAQQQALKPLLVQLLAALDTDNATPAKKCLAVLSQHLPSGALAAILDSVLGYDFRGAEAHVLQLAARNKMDLME
jgi:CheY-like chemotaxis protein